MNTPVYLIDIAQYACPSGWSNRELKGHLKTAHQIDARRLSRLSMLALAGVMSLAQYANEHTAIYTAAHFGSPSIYQNMMDNVFDHAIAKPFDLLAHLHNASSFHVAGQLRSHGATIFQAINPDGQAWQKPLRCAINDIACGDVMQVLLGWCHESGEGDASPEGSVWALLSNEPQNNSVLLSPSDSLSHNEQPYLEQAWQWLQAVSH